MRHDARDARQQRVRSAAVDTSVVVGDRVRCRSIEPGEALIETIHPRRTVLYRKSAGRTSQPQVLAANVDQLLAVFAAARPRPRWGLLDRYLATAEASGIRPILVLSKADLMTEDLEEELSAYRSLGYRVIVSSATTGAGIEELRSALQGKVSVLVGKSGVGKSSLLNAIEPEVGARVQAIGEGTHKGRHTTTQAAWFDLTGEGALIDTPGIREFGILVDGDVDQFFPEMRDRRHLCRFAPNCGHDSEPACAVKEALEDGQIVRWRYDSFLKLQREIRGRS